jgi:hypothetical protein
MLPLAAFGQIQNSIVVTTDKASYSEGETIVITGEVRDLYSGTPVSIVTTAPNGDLVSLSQVTVGSDKKFIAEIAAGGALMKSEGTYTIEVKYGTDNRSATTSFEFGGSTIPPIDTEPTYEKIPSWVKNIFVWYASDQVSETELLNAIEYLINEGTIKIGN